MPNYEYLCDACDSLTVENFPMANRPSEINCVCGGRAIYQISMPNLMLKEALLDGTKRSGWSEMREASKLNKEAIAQKDTQSRKEIEKEIRKMGVQIRKD